MALLRWMVGGIIGSAAGIILWVLIGVFTHMEIGWIAWAVGFLVGVGVRIGAYLNDQEGSDTHGIIASVMAIASIVAAKYIIFSMLFGGAGGGLEPEPGFGDFFTPYDFIWLALATFTAYKVGSGDYGTD